MLWRVCIERESAPLGEDFFDALGCELGVGGGHVSPTAPAALVLPDRFSDDGAELAEEPLELGSRLEAECVVGVLGHGVLLCRVVT